MKKHDLDGLLSVMEKLRAPDGCPWDREQTTSSLVPFIIEEAYEVISAIESGSSEDITEELGDLLFQIVFLCQIGGEKGEFEMADVISGVKEKMIRRHPHVFGGDEAKTAKDVLTNWEKIKEKEKLDKGSEKQSALHGVPDHLPALLRAHKLTEKASRVGFDWNDVEGAYLKITEELAEFREALDNKDATAVEDELGDLIFAIVNVSRFIEVNPESALRKTIGRFITRFHYIEKKLEEEDKNIRETPLDVMEILWNEAKEKEKAK